MSKQVGSKFTMAFGVNEESGLGRLDIKRNTPDSNNFCIEGICLDRVVVKSACRENDLVDIVFHPTEREKYQQGYHFEETVVRVPRDAAMLIGLALVGFGVYGSEATPESYKSVTELSNLLEKQKKENALRVKTEEDEPVDLAVAAELDRLILRIVQNCADDAIAAIKEEPGRKRGATITSEELSEFMSDVVRTELERMRDKDVKLGKNGDDMAKVLELWNSRKHRSGVLKACRQVLY